MPEQKLELLIAHVIVYITNEAPGGANPQCMSTNQQ